MLVLPTRGNTVRIWRYSCIWHVRRHFRRLVDAQVVLDAVAVRGVPILTLRNYCALKEGWRRWVELKSKVKQRLKVHSWHWERQFKPRHKVHLVAFSGAFDYLEVPGKRKTPHLSTLYNLHFHDNGMRKIDWSTILFNALMYLDVLILKWKMWFAWFLVEPNIPLFNALICGLKAVNKPQVYKFSSNNKNQRNCLCPLFLLHLRHYFVGCKKCTVARASSFHPFERYLWWFTPGLPQEMLTTWNKIPPLPRAINKAEICESFSLQRREEKLPRSIVIISSTDLWRYTRAPQN